MHPSTWVSQGDAAAFDSTSPHRSPPLLPNPEDPLTEPKLRVILYMGLQWKSGELAESAPVFSHRTPWNSKRSRYAYSEEGEYMIKCRKKRKQNE